MKVVWTETARLDLEEITAWISANYPGMGAPVERRLRIVVAISSDGPKACAVRSIGVTFGSRRSGRAARSVSL